METVTNKTATLHNMLIAKAESENRILFYVDFGELCDAIPADEFAPNYGLAILAVAYPPGWKYRPNKENE